MKEGVQGKQMGLWGQGPIKWLVFPFFGVPRRTTSSAHSEWQKHHPHFNILYIISLFELRNSQPLIELK